MKQRSLPPFGGASLIGPGLRFCCQGCGRCCSGPGGYVFLTEEEGRAMATHLGCAPEEFFASFTRRAEGRTALIDVGNGNCRFLTSRGCSIYAVRPYQCRSWPFWFANLRSREAWEEAARGCPGIGQGELHSAEEILRWLDGSPFLKGKR
jgi:Fe-S-cluster containining protein